MKRIKFKVLHEYNIGTEEEPIIQHEIQDGFTTVNDEQYEEVYAWAVSVAYNGEVTVEEVEDEVTEPSQLDTIEAQVTYTAMMTDTLLEV